MVGARIRITDNPQAEKPQDIVKKRPASASKDEPPSSKSTLPRPTPPAPLPPPMTLLGGLRRGYVPVRRRNPSGGLQSSDQISPSDGTRRRQLRGRDRQAEEEDGEAGMTEAGMTEAGVTEAGVTEAGKSKTSPELYYNGGAVIMDPVVYLIYYGTWPETELPLSRISCSHWEGTRAGRGGRGVRAAMSLCPSHMPAAPCVLLDTRNPFLDRPDFIAFLPSIHTRPSGHPSCFLPPNYFAVVDRNVGKANRLPSDPSGIYIVITSADVDVWEFSRCSYCGWHAQMMDMRTGSPVAYAFVGHHSLCCQYSNSSPNGLPAIDSMVSTIAHEITEATTEWTGLFPPLPLKPLPMPFPPPPHPLPTRSPRPPPSGLGSPHHYH
ncbi:unnamed protein product [Closterium sp. Naga37s-1]|nr:unnamed protein product [Closterium sp. Naga37s-1]